MTDSGSDALRRRGVKRSPHISGRRPDVRGLPVSEDVRREVELHIVCRTQELIDDGWEPTTAREEAERLFGNTQHIRRECEQITKEKDRMTRLTLFLQGIFQDARYAVRTLLQAPLFTSAAILSLALGIGANTSMFFAVNAFFLSPLRLPEADRLVSISGYNADWPGGGIRFSWNEFITLREGCSTAELAAWFPMGISLLDTGEPIRAQVFAVSWSFPQVLCVQPLLGRLFSASDTEADAPAVVMLTHSFWQERYGGDPGIVGGTVLVDGTPSTVIGVLPGGIEFYGNLDFYILLRSSEIIRPEIRSWRLLGRLDPEYSIAALQSEADALIAGVQEQNPIETETVGAWVEPISAYLFGGAHTPIMILYLFVSLILLLACANVANLMLVRGVHRRREIAIRVSLGAGRGRIVRQLVTESLLLAGAGGVLGVGLGMIGRNLMWSVFPLKQLPVLDLSLNLRAALMLAGIVVLSGFIAGLWPAMVSVRRDIHMILRTASRSLAGDHWRRRLQTLLTVFQIAVALTVLVGTGVLYKEVLSLRSIDPGYDTENLLVGHLKIESEESMPAGERLRFINEVLARLEHRLNVIAASASASLPVRELVKVEYLAAGGLGEDVGEADFWRYNPVLADYFETMRIPLLRGRMFSTTSDHAGTAPVVIVNEAFAERHWPDSDATGQTVRFPGTDGEPEVIATVVGVVGTAEWISTRGAREVVYRPYAQDPDTDITFVVRAGSDPLALVGALKEAVWAGAPELPFRWIQTVEDLIEQENLQTMTLYPWIFGILSMVGLVMALVGVYGVVAFTVSQRTREFGIRLAMGASPGELLSLAMHRGVRLTILGLIVGLPMAILIMRITSSLVPGANPFSLPVLVMAAVLLTGAALGAVYLPAARSVRLDPTEMLRVE